MKPTHIPQAIWDGLNEVGRYYMAQSQSQARLVEDITPDKE